MSKLISKRKNKYVVVSRSLLADTRLSAQSKVLYQVLQSLAESCDNIYPSYTWLAKQIGYDCQGKDQSAPKKLIARAIEPLIEIGLIIVSAREGHTSDYIINDYDELFGQNSHTSVDKIVTPRGQNSHTSVDKNVTPYNISEKEEYSSKSSTTTQPTFPKKIEEVKGDPVKTELHSIIKHHLPDLATPVALAIIAIVMEKAQPEQEDFLRWVLQNKTEDKIVNVGYWRKFYWEDYLTKKTAPPVKIDGKTIEDLDREEAEFFATEDGKKIQAMLDSIEVTGGIYD